MPDPEHLEPERWAIWFCYAHGSPKCPTCGPMDRGELVEVVPASSITSLEEQRAREQRAREDDDSRWANLYSQTLARAEKAEAERGEAENREARAILRAQAAETRLEAVRELCEANADPAVVQYTAIYDFARDILSLLDPAKQRGE